MYCKFYKHYRLAMQDAVLISVSLVVAARLRQILCGEGRGTHHFYNMPLLPRLLHRY